MTTTALASPRIPDAWTRPRLALPKASAPPIINGNLDDPAWSSALRIKAFDRFTGDAPVVEQTDAWVTTDGKTLYVAFHCHDKEPEKQRKSETQRGSQAVWGDDHVTVMIDSQHLHRGMSVFSVNAIGTQVDGLEGGTAGNITWAGDWKASVRNTDDGWIAELAIPFSMMRHPKGADSIGLVLMRSMNRESNPMVWPQIPVEGQSMGAIPQFMPDLQLPSPMPDSRPETIILPFTLGTIKPDGQRARFGLDIKQPISTTLTGLVAINPDFQTI
ncbi:MAG: carbohydrate binding family 9 domain-containing protein, partial [Armatimonadaceae bacterium]